MNAAWTVVVLGAFGALLTDERWIRQVGQSSGEIQSRSMVADQYIHGRTGAKLIAVVNTESEQHQPTESLFAINFRTPAIDDTGVTHVLEHSVFEGSQRYPVMNSISHFDRASMATFVNAMTAPEMTMYPVASTDDQDLENLVSVYLDAVFDPLILESREGFDREGWHYTFEDDTLGYNGVVLNEMKGVYSNPKSLISRTIRRLLYQNSTLGFESGGHPDYIPTLDYVEAIKYYYTYYHPTNAYIFFYGGKSSSTEILIGLLEKVDYYLNHAFERFLNLVNQPQTETARQLRDKVVQFGGKVDERTVRDWVNHETRIAIPDPQPAGDVGNVRIVRQRVPGSTAGAPKVSLRIDSIIDVSYNYTACDYQAMSIMSSLYASTRESPLWSRLEAENVADSITGISISGDNYPSVQFALQLDNVNMDWKCESTECQGMDVIEWIVWLINDEIDHPRSIPRETILSQMKRLEFSLKAEPSLKSSHAMDVFDTVLDPWVYGYNALHNRDRSGIDAVTDQVYAHLDIDAQLSCVRQRFEDDEQYFEKLLQQLHPLRGRKAVVMKAVQDSKIVQEKELAERNKLMMLKQNMTDSELRSINGYARYLTEVVNQGDTKEHLATLPRLSTHRLPREVDPDSYDLYSLNITQLSPRHPLLRHTAVVAASGSTYEVPLFHYPAPTNDLAFVTLHLDLTDLTLAEIAHIPLINYLLNHGYPAGYEPKELRRNLDLYTGGFSLDWNVKETARSDTEHVGDLTEASVVATIKFRCLLNEEDAEHCFSLVQDLLTKPNFQYPHNRQVALNWLNRELASKEQTLLKNSNGVASQHARGKLNVRARLVEIIDGIESIDRGLKSMVDEVLGDGLGNSMGGARVQPSLDVRSTSKSSAFQRLKVLHARVIEAVSPEQTRQSEGSTLAQTEGHNQLQQQPQTPPDGGSFVKWEKGLGQKLRRTWAKVLNLQNLAIQVTCDPERVASVGDWMGKLLTKLPVRTGLGSFDLAHGRRDRPALVDENWLTELLDEWQPSSNPEVELVPADIRVNFNYWVLPIQKVGDPTRIDWAMYSKLVSNKYLTPQVRMIGGAYGVWSSYAYHDGYLVFGSYRDPQRNSTYEHYTKATAALEDVTQDELDGYIIRFIADLDKPASVVERANRQFNRWASQITVEQRQRYRDQILDASVPKLQVYRKALQQAINKDAGVKVTVGPASS